MVSNKVITIVFGDIHGMFEGFMELLGKVNDKFKDNNEQELRMIFLGDYIDRGPDSYNVVDALISMQNHFGPDAVVCLRGNHEEMLLDALRGGKDDEGLFLMNGGMATLKSYGVSSVRDIPFAHKQFFKSLLLSYEDERRYYVHAGIAPTVPLNEQHQYDGHQGLSRTWIRELFLKFTEKHPKYIVHGHTPVGPEVLDNRTNLDSAGVFGYSLTAGIFTEDQNEPVELIQVQTPSRFMRV